MKKTLLALVAAALLIPGQAHAADPQPVYTAPDGLTATEITFHNGGTELHGSIVRKSDLDMSKKHPAIVLVHGSGNTVRAQLAQEAEVFARAGLITLISDKRADYSRSHRDFSALADDAVAGVQALKNSPGVDPGKLGIWGLSEGGWIAPLAASRTDDVKFVVTIGASGVSPAQTQAWNLRNRVGKSGVAQSTSESVVGAGMGLAVGLDMFPAADHDPVPVLRRIKQPVLGIWGELDVLVPPQESAVIFQRELTASPSVTISILPKGSHSGRVTTDGHDRIGGPTIGGFQMGELSPTYGDVMTSWIAKVTSGNIPASTSDKMPVQDVTSTPISPVTWFGIGMFILLILALLSWPIAALKRWGVRPVGAVPARWLVITGLLGSVLGVVFAIYVVAGGGKGLGPDLFGQPLLWLIARILTIVALICTVRVAMIWRKTKSVRLGLVGAGGLLLIPFAFGIGLLLP